MEGPQFLTSAQAPAAVSAVLLSVVGLAVVSACGSSTNAGGANPPAPRGDLYQPPQPMPHRPAGTLIWAEKVPLPLNPPATVWRILDHSRSLSDQHVAVPGFAIVPTSAAPHGRRPVYAWARGTAGQADRCAPSHDLRRNLPPYGGELVARGAALVATDYQGLGTLGEPTYLVGIAEGRAVLDSVRAMKQLPGVGRLEPIVLTGHSQGGGAALWGGPACPLLRAAPEHPRRGRPCARRPPLEHPEIARQAAVQRLPRRNALDRRRIPGRLRRPARSLADDDRSPG
jgi:Secretory lipase